MEFYEIDMGVSRVRKVLSGGLAWVIKHKLNLSRLLLISILAYLGIFSIWLDVSFLDHTQWIVRNTPKGRLWAQVLISMGPELAGIVMGVVTIDYLNERRQDAQLLRQLILQMGSSHNDVTDTAVRTLRSYGWLTDGSLQSADLVSANLKGEDLRDANLEEVDLKVAKLKGAHLDRANLKRARLNGARLEGAYLIGAHMERACLRAAKVNSVDLKGADLRDADLENVEGYTVPQLLQARCLTNATMPDGSKFEEWILRVREGEADPRARAEIDRHMREHKAGEE